MNGAMQGGSLFLGRQPILDRHQATLGYEFHFRTVESEQGVATPSSMATAEMVCGAFAELGLGRALGKQLAFIPVDEEFICNDLIQVLPAEQVVLVVKPDVSAAAIERCRELRSAGYTLAVEGCEGISNGPLLGLASYAKVDINSNDEAHLSATVNHLRTLSLKLIADNVETPETQALAERLGFNGYQGYYFARPVLVSGRKLSVATQTLLRLITLLNQDADTAKLADVMKGEPGLVANLLRLSNSVAVIGVAPKTTSVRHAIALIGRDQLRRWLKLLMFAHPDGRGIRSNPLMQLAALRGHFLELLVQRCYPARPQMADPAFIVGLMSVMPAALEMPMGEILEQITVTPEVREALESRGGQLGQLLELIEYYDNSNIDGAATMLARMGGRLGHQTLNLCLSEAIAWMMNLGEE
jgi:EAL and modified HD-GYP domain-containing signal transduction protein